MDLDDMTYRAEVHRTDEVVYAGHRIIMLSSHEYDDGLGNIHI